MNVYIRSNTFKHQIHLIALLIADNFAIFPLQDDILRDLMTHVVDPVNIPAHASSSFLFQGLTSISLLPQPYITLTSCSWFHSTSSLISRPHLLISNSWLLPYNCQL